MRKIKPPQPRNSYPFAGMKIGDVKSFEITKEDPLAGQRAQRAAYAYGTRNSKKFCSATRTVQKSKRKYMDISRWG